MDAWGWEHLGPWLTDRVELPVGPLSCVILIDAGWQVVRPARVS
jgi:hypothetical protein